MSDQNPVLPLFVSSYSQSSAAENNRPLATHNSNATWPVANTAFYVPMFLRFPYPVRRVFWCNASSVTSANMDFGVYTANGTRVFSTGSVAQVGASLAQYVTAEFLLPQGAYYFALACNTNTASRGGQGMTSLAVPTLAMMGVLQEAAAFPLPATMTPAALVNAMYPYCGVTRTQTGFA